MVQKDGKVFEEVTLWGKGDIIFKYCNKSSKIFAGELLFSIKYKLFWNVKNGGHFSFSRLNRYLEAKAK